MRRTESSFLSAVGCEMDKISTPDLSHLSAADYDHVYEPAEDSFLLLDALEEDLREIRNLQPLFCVEVGCGSGVISSALASVLSSSSVGVGGCVFLATDVNPAACVATARTASANGAEVEPVLANLLGGLRHRLRAVGGADVVVCNPPYVSTSEEERAGAAGLRAAWAGGAGGRSVTDLLVSALPEVLSERGRCYLVVEQCNDPEEVVGLAQRQKLEAEVVMRRRAGREVLHVCKISRQC